MTERFHIIKPKTIIMFFCMLLSCIIISEPVIRDLQLETSYSSMDARMADPGEKSKDNEETIESTDYFLHSDFWLLQNPISDLQHLFYHQPPGFSQSCIDIQSPPPKN